MDIITPIAFLIAVGAVVGADMLDGGTITALVNLPAMVLVLGGTMGVTVMSVASADLRKVPSFLFKVFRPKLTRVEQSIDDIAALAEVARREGLLRLEDELSKRTVSPFLARGVQLIVDGADEDRIRLLMEQELSVFEEREANGAIFFETAGGFAPTLGIIGTVVGLVSVLSNLSDIQKLAPSIATAFIATLWGVSSANLFWLPIGNKIKNTLRHEVRAREMIIEGCIAIAAGQNPRLIAEQLAVFRDDKRGKKGAKESQEGEESPELKVVNK
jgi:chemotaxis protein MotA